MNDIVHIEFGVTNILRAQQFYQKVFKWKVEDSDIPDYLFVEFENKSTNLSLGIELSDYPTLRSVVFYINVTNISETLELVLKHGGKVILEKQQLPGNRGFIGKFEDPFGNQIGIWQETNLE